MFVVVSDRRPYIDFSCSVLDGGGQETRRLFSLVVSKLLNMAAAVAVAAALVDRVLAAMCAFIFC